MPATHDESHAAALADNPRVRGASRRGRKNYARPDTDRVARERMRFAKAHTGSHVRAQSRPGPTSGPQKNTDVALAQPGVPGKLKAIAQRDHTPLCEYPDRIPQGAIEDFVR